MTDTASDRKEQGRRAGGIARAAKLSPARRRQIAQKAACARWGDVGRPRVSAGTIELRASWAELIGPMKARLRAAIEADPT